MKGEYKISLLFFLLSFFWITFSDKWLYSWEIGENSLFYYSAIKGYFFISLSTILIFFLIREERIKLKIRQDENIQLMKIMDTIENHIVITNIEGKITWVNKSFENHTGYLLEEVMNQYPGSFLRGEESSKEAEDCISAAVQNQSPCSVEIVNYTKSKEKYWVRIHFAPLFDDQKNIKGYFSIQTNITSYRETQKILCDQNKVLKEIAWITSHQLRKPVASILGINELIKIQSDIREKEELFKMLNDCTNDLDSMMKHIAKKVNDIESVEV